MRFNTGALRDSAEEKTDFIDGISWTALDRFAKYMDLTKKKHGKGNFKKGIPIEVYEKALVRHLVKYLKNKYEKGNDEKEQDHLGAIIFNTFGIMHEEETLKLNLEE